MIRALFLLIIALLTPASAVAQTLPLTPTPADVRVALETSAGRIVVAVHVGQAPITGGNFLRYVDQKRFDCTLFYRAFGTPDYGFVQGGTKNDPKRVRPPIAHEPTTKTGLTHDDGALSMARDVPGTANGDFFIVLGKMPSMDADPKAAGDKHG